MSRNQCTKGYAYFIIWVVAIISPGSIIESGIPEEEVEVMENDKEGTGAKGSAYGVYFVIGLVWLSLNGQAEEGQEESERGKMSLDESGQSMYLPHILLHFTNIWLGDDDMDVDLDLHDSFQLQAPGIFEFLNS